MSQPNIPNITPNISLHREDAINLILSSIAMEELGLSHILNAEGEKLQYVLGTLPGLSGPAATIDDLLAVNDSVRNTLDSATRNQMFLQSKMESALRSSVMVGPTGPAGPTGPSGSLNEGDLLFNVNGTTGSAPIEVGSELTFQSDTLDIEVTPGSAIVTIENPTGPAIGSIIPYSHSSLYLSISISPEYVLDNNFFVVPVNGVLGQLSLSLQVRDITIGQDTEGIVKFNVYSTPIDAYAPVRIAKGSFSPLITRATPSSSFITVSEMLGIPILANTRIGISLSYETSDSTDSIFYAAIYGGLQILPE